MYKRININLKSIIYICLASFFFSLMSTFVKLSSLNLNLIEIIFLRSFVSTLILMPFICFLKLKVKSNLYLHHFTRAVIGISAMFLNFYAISKLPLTNFTIISFAKIFFIVPLAYVFLGEKIKISYIFYIFIGFIGIIFILGYEKAKFTLLPYYFCAILASFLIAYIKIFVKNISKLENNIIIQFYFSLNSLIILFIPYLTIMSKILLIDFFFIFLLSIFGLLAQYFTIEGLKTSLAVKVMPFDFSRIIFSSIIGISFFSEKITVSMVFGTLIIIFAGIKLIEKTPST